MRIQNLDERIQQKASQQAHEEMTKLVEDFFKVLPRHTSDPKVYTDVKIPEAKYSQRVEVEVNMWDLKQRILTDAIKAREIELISEISEQVLKAVDDLEFLKSEVQQIQQER